MDRDDVKKTDTQTPVVADVAVEVTPTTTTAPVVTTTPATTTVKVEKVEDRDDDKDEKEGMEEKAEKPVTPPTQPVVTGPKTYTMAEVKAKADAGACWTVIKGQVYDLSDFITKHPGGAGAIKSLCGIDGTAKFTAMHGGQPKPEAVLASHLVGAVK